VPFYPRTSLKRAYGSKSALQQQQQQHAASYVAAKKPIISSSLHAGPALQKITSSSSKLQCGQQHLLSRGCIQLRPAQLTVVLQLLRAPLLVLLDDALKE
jgi:hypothetical protein